MEIVLNIIFLLIFVFEFIYFMALLAAKCIQCESINWSKDIINILGWMVSTIIVWCKLCL